MKNKYSGLLFHPGCWMWEKVLQNRMPTSSNCLRHFERWYQLLCWMVPLKLWVIAAIWVFCFEPSKHFLIFLIISTWGNWEIGNETLSTECSCNKLSTWYLISGDIPLIMKSYGRDSSTKFIFLSFSFVLLLISVVYVCVWMCVSPFKYPEFVSRHFRGSYRSEMVNIFSFRTRMIRCSAKI